MSKKGKTVQGDLIFGIHPIIELLKAKRRKLITLYTTKIKPKAFSKIEKLIPKHVPIQYVSRDVLTKMVNGGDHQGFVAWVQAFPFRKKVFDPQKHTFLLMLDGIQDVGNLGAILRSAYCVDVDGIIITKKQSAPLNATTIKASAGLAEHLEIYVSPSAQAAAQELKQAGYNLYLASFDGKDATTVQYDKPVCLVIGGEGAGISPAVYKYGQQVTLPQRTADISYNASVAAGILLFLVSQKIKQSYA